MDILNYHTSAIVKKGFERSIPDCLEEHARRYADQVAFKTKKISITWDALNQSANRVARAIMGTSERRDRPIALLFDTEVSLMPAALGVLKTGGFYVGLSPSHPRLRNDYILNETEACLILTDNRSFSLAEELAHSTCHLLNIDAIDSSLSTENLGLPMFPDSIAFLTYTSGSTGEPKGIVNTHRKALYRIRHDELFGLGPNDRFTQPGSTERRSPFGPLLSGAASFPWYVNEDGLTHLADWLIQEQVTVYRSSPRIFREFVRTLTGTEEFPKLRVIVLADEPVYKSDFELFKKHFSSDCLLVNTYGAHEIGPIRMYLIGKEKQITGSRVPIGYAIPDREVILLSDNRQEVDFNQIGEIAVRSRDILPNFWRRPDITDPKFVPDPKGGDRLIYLTGDLGRMLPDGCLEHLGRKDFQVKIRGLRVEIDEVEGALRSMSSIREAVVVAQKDQSSDNYLVAYVVSAENTSLSGSEIRRFLEQRLPPLMIPARFVVLDALPLTQTGKVNRKALPKPNKARPELEVPYIPPRTQIESELSQIWSEVFSLDQVGICDSFIELGGHSLMATQIISQVIKKFQVEIPIRALYEAPTVAEMAIVLTEHQGKQLKAGELERILEEVESLSDKEIQK